MFDAAQPSPAGVKEPSPPAPAAEPAPRAGLVDEVAGELVEIRALLEEILRRRAEPRALVVELDGEEEAEVLKSLPPRPKPPKDSFGAEVDRFRCLNPSWEEMERFFDHREACSAAAWDAYDAAIAQWEADRDQALEAACAAKQVPANDQPEPAETVLQPSPASATSGLVASIQAGVFGRMAAELLRARSEVAHEQIAEVGEMLMAELRRELGREQELRQIEAAAARAAATRSEVEAIGNFRDWLGKKRIAL
jgi:hypothetical protein